MAHAEALMSSSGEGPGCLLTFEKPMEISIRLNSECFKAFDILSFSIVLVAVLFIILKQPTARVCVVTPCVPGAAPVLLHVFTVLVLPTQVTAGEGLPSPTLPVSQPSPNRVINLALGKG